MRFPAINSAMHCYPGRSRSICVAIIKQSSSIGKGHCMLFVDELLFFVCLLFKDSVFFMFILLNELKKWLILVSHHQCPTIPRVTISPPRHHVSALHSSQQRLFAWPAIQEADRLKRRQSVSSFVWLSTQRVRLFHSGVWTAITAFILFSSYLFLLRSLRFLLCSFQYHFIVFLFLMTSLFGSFCFPCIDLLPEYCTFGFLSVSFQMPFACFLFCRLFFCFFHVFFIISEFRILSISSQHFFFSNIFINWR